MFTELPNPLFGIKRLTGHRLGNPVEVYLTLFGSSCGIITSGDDHCNITMTSLVTVAWVAVNASV